MCRGDGVVNQTPRLMGHYDPYLDHINGEDGLVNSATPTHHINGEILLKLDAVSSRQQGNTEKNIFPLPFKLNGIL